MTSVKKTTRRRARSVAAASSSPAPSVKAVDFMDPTPTPWYKRDFDVHIALDKGLGSVLLLAATAVHLGYTRPLSGGLYPLTPPRFYLHPLVIGLVLPPVLRAPLSLARKAWTAVWRGKALFACGVVGLPDRTFQSSVQRFGRLIDALMARLVATTPAPPPAEAAAPRPAE